MKKALALVATLTVFSACATTYHPSNQPRLAPCSRAEALPAFEVQRRLAIIEHHLQTAQRRTRTWFATWLSLMGGSTLLQGALIYPARHFKALQTDLAIGTFGTFVASMPLIFSPRAALGAADRLSELTQDNVDATARLCAAESLLETAAHDAEAGTSWVAHAVGDGAAVAIGLVQWLAFHHLRSGIITGVGGSLGNEVLVYSMPKDVIAAWSSYRNEVLGEATPPQGEKLSWSVGVAPRSLTLRVAF